MREINAKGDAIACYVSVESCRNISDADRTMPAICESIQISASRFNLPVPEVNGSASLTLLNNILGNWAKLVAPKPLVVLFDEVDVLIDETMLNFLSQLRSGFASRGIGTFPVSIVLVGLRDLKDYITASKGGIAPNPGSPFNIKADSAILANFNREDVEHLFAQRTAENGQLITTEALNYAYEQSKGQPWIVNNLFMRATMRIIKQESTETVTLAYIEEARQQMILARETHLDALAERLKDPKIRNVIEPIITGEMKPLLAESDAFRFCLDLGLVAIDDGTPIIANPIYREVIARQLTYGQLLAIPKPNWQWQKEDGSLDMDRILKEFQKFWQRHSDVWESQSNYNEAFPHLLLMAFLQRILNGGGTDSTGSLTDIACAAGRGRMDLLIEYNGRSHIIEIKLIHYYETPSIVREEGLEQIRWYRDKFSPGSPAYLVIFDRRPKAKEKSWEERIKWELDNEITVLGC